MEKAAMGAAYYLNLYEPLEKFARELGLEEERWKDIVVKDLTGGPDGKLVYLPIGSPREPNIGLYGERFFAKACRDKGRHDTLFVFYLDIVPELKTSPEYVAGPWRGLHRCGNKNAPAGKSIIEAIPHLGIGSFMAEAPVSPMEPSPALESVLRTVLPTIPIRNIATTRDDELEHVLPKLQQVLTLHRLRPLLPLKGRQKLILDGAIHQVPHSGIRGLLDLLGFPLLDRILTEYSEQDLGRFLPALCSLPIDAWMRGYLVRLFLEGAEDSFLECFRELLSITPEPPDPTWNSLIARALERVARRTSNAELARDLHELSGGEEGQLWARIRTRVTAPAASHTEMADASEQFDLTTALERLQIDEMLTHFKEQLDHISPLIQAQHWEFPKSLAELEPLRRRANDLQQELEVLLRSFPESQRVASAAEERKHVAAQLVGLVPRETLAQICVVATGLKPLQAACEVAIHGAKLPFPTWFWIACTGTSEPKVEDIIYALAGDVQRRNPLHIAVDWVNSLNREERIILPDITRSDEGEDDVLEALKHGLEQTLASRHSLSGRLQALKGHFSCLLSIDETVALTDQVSTAALLSRLESIQVRIEQAAARLGDRAGQELQEFSQRATNLDELEQYIDVIAAYSERIASNILRYLPSLTAVLETGRVYHPEISEVTKQDEKNRPVLSLEHCISDPKVRAASLSYRAAMEDRGYGTVDVPLRLRRDTQPAAVRVELALDAPHLRHRPSDWLESVKSKILEVRENAWFSVGSSYAFDFVWDAIPIPRPMKPGDQQALSELVLQISGQVRDKNERFGPIKLTWSRISLEREEAVHISIPTTTEPKEMKRHPIGVQKHFGRLQSLMQEGQASFLVAAPRRFGKTTLLAALIEATRECGDIMPVSVTASPFLEPRSFWLDTGQKLGELLDVHVSGDWEGDFPPAQVFDSARRKAASKGIRTIYLLIDEAQALFAGRHGVQIAEQFKVAIESTWSRPRDGRCAMHVGLVGQMHLQKLIGVNFQGALESFVEDRIDGDSLLELTRAHAQGILETTAEAREHLGRLSGNLYALKVLLSKISERAHQQGHCWILRSDVDAAADDLIDEASQSYEHAIWSYLRDPLNAAENLSNWQPIAAFPVAMAWANALAENLEDQDAREWHAQQLLSRWARNISKYSTFPRDKVIEHLRSLQKHSVLHAGEFRAPLLERMLNARSRWSDPLPDVGDRQAMIAAMVDMVSIPQDGKLEQIGEGGQATIYRGEIDGRMSALRLVELARDEHRIAFLKMGDALKILKGISTHERGLLALPYVRKCGLTDEPQPRGALLYDWVPGTDLAQNRGKLAPALVAEIGVSLAYALCLLEERDIVHRDIRPENVILRPDGQAVLIDFGLLRARDHVGNTSVMDARYVAPEVRQDPSHAGTPADVYALGITLEVLLAEREPSLDRLLARMQADDPKERISPAQLIQEMKTLLDTLGFTDRKRAVEQEVNNLLDGVSEEWARQIARNYRPEISAASFFTYGKETLASVAAFENDLFVAWVRREGHSFDSLAELNHAKRKELPEPLQRLHGKLPAAVGHLRNSGAHRSKTGIQRWSRALECVRGEREPVNRQEQLLGSALVETAKLLEHASGVTGIQGVVKHWLEEDIGTRPRSS